VIEQPFPHVILKPHWADKALRTIASEFPPYDDPRWTSYPDAKERGKKAGDRSDMWGPATKTWFDYVRSPVYLSFLTKLTGIEGLVADTWGGGMHCTGEGGRLAMHVDFSVHPDHPTLTRRLNMLTFLNPEWEPSWGGMLYLGAKRQVKVLPLLNTTVIFETSARSFHGHPDPVAGPHLRKSLACYFYAPRQSNDDLLTTTVWQ
jgi:hypothetical protein